MPERITLYSSKASRNAYGPLPTGQDLLTLILPFSQSCPYAHRVTHLTFHVSFREL